MRRDALQKVAGLTYLKCWGYHIEQMETRELGRLLGCSHETARKYIAAADTLFGEIWQSVASGRWVSSNAKAVCIDSRGYYGDQLVLKLVNTGASCQTPRGIQTSFHNLIWSLNADTSTVLPDVVLTAGQIRLVYHNIPPRDHASIQGLRRAQEHGLYGCAFDDIRNVWVLDRTTEAIKWMVTGNILKPCNRDAALNACTDTSKVHRVQVMFRSQWPHRTSTTTEEEKEEPTMPETVKTVEAPSSPLDQIQEWQEKAQDFDNLQATVQVITDEKTKVEQDLDKAKQDLVALRAEMATALQNTGSSTNEAALQKEVERLTKDIETLAARTTNDGSGPVEAHPPTVSEQVKAYVDASHHEPVPGYLTGKLDKEDKGIVWLAAKRKVPLLLAGPSGTGKTEMAQNLFARMYGKWLQVNFSGDSSKAQLICRTGAMAGQTYPIIGPIVAGALGGIPTILDELGHSEPGTASALHNLVREGVMLVEELNETIVAKDPWCVIATDNGVGDDTGMYSHARIEATFLDRFDVRRVDYPTVAREKKILKHQVPGLDPEWIGRVAETFKALRQDADASCPFTVRKAVQTCKWIDELTRVEGMDMSTAISHAVDLCITHRVPPDEHAKIQEVVQRFLSVDLAKGGDDENSYNFSEFDAGE